MWFKNTYETIYFCGFIANGFIMDGLRNRFLIGEKQRKSAEGICP